MVKNLDRKIAKLERTIDRAGAKVESLKKRHAHALMNEARVLLGKSPKKFGSAKTTRKAKAPKGQKPAAQKTNGGDKK